MRQLKVKQTEKAGGPTPILRVDAVDLTEDGDQTGLAAQITLGQRYELFWATISDGDQDLIREITSLTAEDMAEFVQKTRKIARENGCRFEEPAEDFYATLAECVQDEAMAEKVRTLVGIQRIGLKKQA